MMFFTTRSLAALYLLCLPSTILAQASFDRPCPILGLEYPNPSSYASNSAFMAAMQTLQIQITGAMNGTAASGSFNSSTTGFSVNVFSLYDDDDLFTYHFTPQALIAQHAVGVQTVDSNSIYRIGSVSKLYTVYLYLLTAGDETWNSPVANFVPEIAAYVARNAQAFSQNRVDITDWSSITVGALASQLAGLPRDVAYSTGLDNALMQSFGIPPPSNASKLDCGDDASLRLPCNRSEFFEKYLPQHPIIPSFTTPIYSNPPYQLLAYVVENITGGVFPDLFETEFVQPLGLNATYYTVPPTTNTSFIPFNESLSAWSLDARDEGPVGGYYSSINDMRKIGRAIMNSTQLTPAQTRRWMQPAAFTSNLNFSVGAPWEILRAPSDRVSWLYTKSGDIGAYSAESIFLPEYGVGITILAAGSAPYAAVPALADAAVSAVVPAVEAAAKANAASTFAGTYSDQASNSSITLSVTDTSLGLAVTAWTFNGTNVLSTLGGLLGAVPMTSNLTVSLLYTGLDDVSNGTTMSWRASYQVLPQPLDTSTFSINCVSWAQVNTLLYDGLGFDEFLITLDANGSTATSVQHRVFGVTLQRSAT